MTTRTYVVSGDDEGSARVAAVKAAESDGFDPLRIVDVRYRGEEHVNGIKRDRFAVTLSGDALSDGIEGIHGVRESEEPPLCFCGHGYQGHAAHPESELRALAGDR